MKCSDDELFKIFLEAYKLKEAYKTFFDYTKEQVYEYFQVLRDKYEKIGKN